MWTFLTSFTHVKQKLSVLFPDLHQGRGELRAAFWAGGFFCGIFVDTFAERPAHAFSQKNSGVAKLIAQLVRRGERLRPFALLGAIEQVELSGRLLEIRSVDAQQADRTSAFPMDEEQSANGRGDFR